MPLDTAKIKARQEALGLTHQQAGEAAGFAPTTARQSWYKLINVTQGSPTLETLERLCEAMKCPLADLLTDGSPAAGPRPRSKDRNSPSPKA